MSNIKIKICGISDIKTLNKVCELNIDYAGFIFFDDSIRNVDFKFIESIKNTQFTNTRPVCVFVNPSEGDVYKAKSFFNNPVLQFHGDESFEFCESFGCDYWKTIHIQSKNSLDLIDKYESADAFLLETHQDGLYGGTGKTFDWSLISDEIIENTNIVLSGGINLQNVDNAKSLTPWCLDINSSLESEPGIKDILLIEQMIEKIRL